MIGSNKHYLGDGVYINFDGYQVILTTENGIRVTNTIYLEPEVLLALFAWLKTIPEVNRLLP